MFASLEEAVTEGKAKASTLSNGELDALHCTSRTHSFTFVSFKCPDPLHIAGFVAKRFRRGGKGCGRQGVAVGNGKEFQRWHMRELPDKMLPVAVDKLILRRTKDGTGDA